MWMAAAEQHPILRRPFSMCFTAAESPATLPPNRPWITSKGTELARRNEGFDLYAMALFVKRNEREC